MKKQKQPKATQLDLWGNKKSKKKMKKFSQFDAERALVVQMLNDKNKDKTP